MYRRTLPANTPEGASPGVDPRYMALERELSETKSKLDSIPDKDFRSVQRALDVYMPLKRLLQKDVRARCVTNAWLKMRELAPLLFEDESVRVFANAELPGAFIEAMCHYAADRDIDLDWIASSLWSSEKDALGDFAGVYRENRSHWLMDESCDGDLTVPETVAELVTRARAGGPITVYTSDGGVDVSSNYNNQELMNYPLHLGQAICGLLALEPGGTILLKQYTWMEHRTRMLIAYLTSKFEDFQVVKPLTSRPGNSEVYLLGKNFLGLSDLDRVRLERALSGGFLDEDISPALESKLYEVAHDLSTRQCAHINALVSAAAKFRRMKRRDREAWIKQQQQAARPVREEWLKLANIRPR